MRFFLGLFLCFYSFYTQADEAFGKPGLPPIWSSAKKIHVSTFYNKYSETQKSTIWLSLAEGVLTEVFYPHIDRPQLKDAQIIVVDRKGRVWREKEDLNHSVKVIHPSLVKIKNSEPTGRFSITHTFYPLKDKATIIDQVEVQAFEQGLEFYVLVNPHLNNSGIGDSAFAHDDSLEFSEKKAKLKVYSSTGFEKTSVGFVGFSDGYQDLAYNGAMNFKFTSAINGNVAGMGKLRLSNSMGKNEFWVAYDFSQSAPRPKENSLKEYVSAWDGYLRNLKRPTPMSSQQLKLYLRSLVTIKTHEDKIQPGAMAASLSKPWGDLSEDKSNGESGGYHLTWPRDLFHKAYSLLNSGDYQTAYNALKFLKKIQFKSGVWQYGPRVIPRIGAFPQNVWTSGDEYWTGLQLDQVGYPIQLFYHLWKRASAQTKEALQLEFAGMLRLASNFIAQFGPWSAQERWEENFGISPSTFAVATRALIMASEIFREERYEKIARGWLTKPGDNIFDWTVTKNGIYGDGEYFVRVSGCSNFIANWNPNIFQSCHISNSHKRFDQRKILDQGFLKLPLMGLVPASDERIKKSVDVVNQHISAVTPKGRGWYRYTEDSYGYGENYKGRLWPLLSSEHGRYYLELLNEGALSEEEALSKVNAIIDSYVGFANAGQMIPEQVFETTGEGTGAATPLAWSHAEYIKMLWSRHFRKNVENPEAMYE